MFEQEPMKRCVELSKLCVYSYVSTDFPSNDLTITWKVASMCEVLVEYEMIIIV